MEKPPFKLGISLGQLHGQREFSTAIEHPPFAVNQANHFIHEHYSQHVSLYLVDESQPRSRRSRRRI